MDKKAKNFILKLYSSFPTKNLSQRINKRFFSIENALAFEIAEPIAEPIGSHLGINLRLNIMINIIIK